MFNCGKLRVKPTQTSYSIRTEFVGRFHGIHSTMSPTLKNAYRKEMSFLKQVLKIMNLYSSSYSLDLLSTLIV